MSELKAVTSELLASDGLVCWDCWKPVRVNPGALGLWVHEKATDHPVTRVGFVGIDFAAGEDRTEIF
jgi:hypothetical protein